VYRAVERHADHRLIEQAVGPGKLLFEESTSMSIQLSGRRRGFSRSIAALYVSAVGGFVTGWLAP
jgi:hypothetical protein